MTILTSAVLVARTAVVSRAEGTGRGDLVLSRVIAALPASGVRVLVIVGGCNTAEPAAGPGRGRRDAAGWPPWERNCEFAPLRPGVLCSLLELFFSMLQSGLAPRSTSSF